MTNRVVVLEDVDANGVVKGDYTHKQSLQAVLDACPDDVNIHILELFDDPYHGGGNCYMAPSTTNVFCAGMDLYFGEEV